MTSTFSKLSKSEFARNRRRKQTPENGQCVVNLRYSLQWSVVVVPLIVVVRITLLMYGSSRHKWTQTFTTGYDNAAQNFT